MEKLTIKFWRVKFMLMAEVGAEEIQQSKEAESPQVNPVNKLDRMLFEIANEKFSGDWPNSETRKEIERLAEAMLQKVEESHDYFNGNADEGKYKDIDKTKLRPTLVSPTYGAGEVSENIVAALAQKLGLLTNEESIDALEQNDKWELNVSRKSGSIKMPIDQEKNPATISLAKDYSGPVGRGEKGNWGFSLHYPGEAFEKSLDMPIAPSAFHEAASVQK